MLKRERLFLEAWNSTNKCYVYQTHTSAEGYSWPLRELSPRHYHLDLELIDRIRGLYKASDRTKPRHDRYSYHSTNSGLPSFPDSSPRVPYCERVRSLFARLATQHEFGTSLAGKSGCP